MDDSAVLKNVVEEASASYRFSFVKDIAFKVAGTERLDCKTCKVKNFMRTAALLVFAYHVECYSIIGACM